MPTPVTAFTDLRPGDIYEDTFHHPCLCVEIEEGTAMGISLVDGSYPRSACIGVSNVRKLTSAEAWRWRMCGPDDVELEPGFRWWSEATVRSWESSVRERSRQSRD